MLRYQKIWSYMVCLQLMVINLQDIWDKGNRKPRRTMKGHPHAGHMGMETVTVKNIKIVENLNTKENIM
jgi:hypothetical protein